jgi:RNA 2',3'-cyclic 3'-phosphodiesterase
MAAAERIFLAVPITDSLREQLQELQEISLEILRDHNVTNARAENLRNSHITVRFLGDIVEPFRLIDSLDAKILATQAFSFCINEIGAFDSSRKARVLWAGVDQQEGFTALRKEVDELLQPLGFDEEKESYHPHLTLARFRETQDIRNCFDELKQLTDVCSIRRYTVEEVILYSSKLSPQGATHTKRALLKLS